MFSRSSTLGQRLPGFLKSSSSLKGRSAAQNDAHYYHLISIAGCKKNFAELTPTQQELISVAELYCFEYRFIHQPIRAETRKAIFTPLEEAQLSRVDASCDASIFNTGLYVTQNIEPGDPVGNHLDRGGDSSLFRGATVSQNESITHQDEPLLRYHAISMFGINVLGLSQALTDYPTLCQDVFGRRRMQLFLEESETLVPRPIPSENIQEIIRRDKAQRPCKNTAFIRSKVKKIHLNWQDLFLSLQDHQCLNGRKK